MSDARSLVRAILGSQQCDDFTAGRILHDALVAEVDPLHYCVLKAWVSDVEAMSRSARWAGLGFFDRVPRRIAGGAEPAHLEALAEVRTFRVRMLDRDVLFCSPTFFHLLQLRQRVLLNPELRTTLCLVPEKSLRAYLVDASAPALTTAARQRLARRWPFATAHLEATLTTRIIFVAGLLALLTLVLMSPFLASPVLLPLAVLLIAMPAALTVAAITRPRLRRERAHQARPNDAELPIYSVLIPLRDEAQMVPQLAEAMLALDYPADRLDIKFVVETRSPETIAAANAQLHHSQFSLVSVPDAAPRTKPKALDFALPLCRGEYVVVFDAEDRPHPDQLWQAAVLFRDRDAVQCIQAELVIDNGHESLLSALFAGEYSGLFGIKLPALAQWNLPLPLGGSSNHFRTATLRDIGGWDAYNVTEDADLGARLARLRLQVATLITGTLEEAPTELGVWMAQRTRWMKGWMQTFIVHNCHPLQSLSGMGWRGFLCFEIMALGQIAAPLLHSGFTIVSLIRLAAGLPIFGSEGGWTLIYPAMFGIGYLAVFMQTLAGLWRLPARRPPLLVQLLLPLYWLLISAATVRALLELLDRPFYWAKTAHRVTGAAATVDQPKVAVKPRNLELAE